jgi:hypothetical protein
VSGFGVALFDTTSLVMRAEKLLQRNGVTVKLIPTPRQFSSDCGMAVRFPAGDMDRVRAVLAQARLATAGLHFMDSPA